MIKHHESITIDPYNLSKPNIKEVQVTIETKTILDQSTSSSSSTTTTTTTTATSNNSNQLVNPKDAFLLSILERMGLDSFSISISDSSDSSMTQSDLKLYNLKQTLVNKDNNGVDSNENSNDKAYDKANDKAGSNLSLNFPVGTTIQYKKSAKVSNSTTNTNTNTQVDGDTFNEKNLIRLLSTSGLFCQNVQTNDILRSLTPTSTRLLNPTNTNTSTSTSTSTSATTGKTPDSDTGTSPAETTTQIIMFPNDAYNLCHTRSLYNMITASNPCRDKHGVFSRLQFDTLNHIDTSNKAIWMSVERRQDDDTNNSVNIDWGIRFQKRLYTSSNSISLMDVMFDKEEDYDYEDEISDGVKDLRLEHCPLTTSSTILTRNGTSYDTHDLQFKSISMSEEWIQMNDVKNEKGKMGIERHILRRSGIAHFGTFESRFYYGEEDDDNDGQEGGVDVTIMEKYPSIVNPIFYSLKAFLIQDSINVNNETQTIIELSVYDKPNFHLEQYSDGSASVSFTTHLPPKSSLYVQMDYEPRYLPFELFPADPNRGFDLPPIYATFSTSSPSSSSPFTTSTLLFSNALLIMPPVPDMSMPFNVISLYGTCFAILIGTSVNIIIKKASENVSDALNGIEQKRPIDKIKDKVKSKINAIRQKLFTKKVKVEKKLKEKTS